MVLQLSTPTHPPHTFKPPPFWHQAFACEFSAVCALNRPYQEQTILEGVTLTECIEWEIKVLFINTWIIQRHFKDICWKTSSHGLWLPLIQSCSLRFWCGLSEPLCVMDGPPWLCPTSLRSTININWAVGGGRLQKTEKVCNKHEGLEVQIIYAEQDTTTLR